MDINSIKDALINLSQIVENTEMEYENVIAYLNDYIIVGKVVTNILKDVVIKGKTLKLEIPDDELDKFLKNEENSEDFWKKHFIKLDEAFNSNIEMNVKPLTEDNAFLTKEALEELSAFSKKNVLIFDYINYNPETLEGITIESLQNEPGLVLPLFLIRKIALEINNSDIVTFNVDNLEAKISFPGLSVVKIKDKNLTFEGFDFGQKIFKYKSLKSNDMDFNLDEVASEFLLKNSNIPNDLIIPKGANTNIAVFDDILKSPYIKTGDKVDIKIEGFKDYETLKAEIDSHFSGNNKSSLKFDNNYLVSKDDLDKVIGYMISFFTV